MKILEANIYGYGRFVDCHFDVAHRFQVITGPNESGKSTLRSFISSILFGFPTKRGKKETYIPRKGSVYGGNLLILQNEQKYLIERIGNEKNNSLTIINQETKEKLPESLLEKWITKVDKTVFDDIYSVNQSELSTILNLKPDELERIFYSIATSGSQEIFEKQKKLIKEANQLYKPNGRVPQINLMLKKYEGTYQKFQEISNNLDDFKMIEEKIENLKEKTSKFSQEKMEYENKLARLNQLESTWDIYQKWLGASKNYNENALNIPIEVFDKIQLQNTKVNSIESSIQSLEKQLEDVRQEVRKLDSNGEDIDFYLNNKEKFNQIVGGERSTSSYVEDSSNENSQVLRRRSHTKSKNKQPNYTIIAIVVISILAIIFIPNIFIRILGMIGLFFGGYLFIKDLNPVYSTSGITQENQEIFDFCKKKLQLSDDYTANMRKILNFKLQIEKKIKLRDNTKVKEKILEQERSINLSSLRVEQVKLAKQLEEMGFNNFNSLRENFFKEQGKLKLESTIIGLKSQLSDEKINALKKYSTKIELEKDIFSTKKNYEEKRVKNEQRIAQLIEYKIQLDNIGNSVEFATLQQEMANERSNINNTIEEWLTMSLANKWLDEYLATLSKHQLPLVMERASKFFEVLTNKHFVKISVGNNQLFLKTIDNQIFTVNELSRATAEQLYFALRIAFIVIFNKKIGLPMIIDDGFVNFDEERKSQIIDLLLEISKETQILCFTVDISIICDKVSKESILAI